MDETDLQLQYYVEQIMSTNHAGTVDAKKLTALLSLTDAERSVGYKAWLGTLKDRLIAERGALEARKLDAESTLTGSITLIQGILDK